jgi:hypothetical protein
MSSSGATLRSEWALLLAGCSSSPHDARIERLKKLLQAPIAWQNLFSLAEHQGVQPLLFEALNLVQDVVPEAEFHAWKRAYDANLVKNLLLARELIRIVAHLCANQIQVLAYKGLSLAEALYRDVALRQSGDIDLLVQARDLRRAREALLELGYSARHAFSEQQERFFLRSGYECVFDGAAGQNILEVQWAFQPRFYAIDFDMDGVFERASNISVAGQTMRTPSCEDLLLSLTVHAAKHVWSRLLWLCDIARLIAVPTMDWVWVISQAKELGVLRILHVNVLAANALLEANIPAVLRPSLARDRIAGSLAGEVQRQMTGSTAPNLESVSYFRLMLRLRERLSDRLRFLKRLTFTPGPSEWKTIELPPTLFPLYRLVRLSRLAARAIGR